MGPSVTEATNPAAEKLSAPARLERRTEDAFAEEERHGLMLAAKVRMIALIVILLWQAVDNPQVGLEYALGLAEVASFAVLGLLQYICGHCQRKIT